MLQEGRAAGAADSAPDNQCMHLMIPFASALSDEFLQVLPTLALPNLSRLVGRLAPAARADGDEYQLSPPHERALATLWGWHGADGALPFAAHAAAADGIETGDRAWGLVTPAHWHVGREHIMMADPEALALGAAESRALFDAVRELFESKGYDCAWGAPARWYLSHPGLADLPCASLDRVIGRNVDFWLGSAATHPRAAPIRRLQSEVQLLLYPHPLNEAREARGELAVNSFWLSGCGLRQAADETRVEIEPTLRRALLGGDAAAWIAAWNALDAGPITRLLRAAEAAEEPVMLTLCGERSWQRCERAPRSWWQRLQIGSKAPRIAEILQGL